MQVEGCAIDEILDSPAAVQDIDHLGTYIAADVGSVQIAMAGRLGGFDHSDACIDKVVFVPDVVDTFVVGVGGWFA